MLAFGVRQSVAYTTRHGYRRLEAVAAGRRIGSADLVVAIGGEPRHAQRAIDEAARAAAGLAPDPDAALPERLPDLRFHSEATLRKWRHFPVRLGRLALAGDGAASEIAEAAPLRGQLESLRLARPHRRHFRIALVNGFGSNLGDTILGATAWRAALPVLRSVLPSVAADVLLGPVSQPEAAMLIGHEDGIGQVLFRGPTLRDFARYDAFFDFDDLANLPRFTQGAHVDWVLWWLGLDPAATPDHEKRNRVWLPASSWAWAGERLGASRGPKIAFAWRASVLLRSMPDATARAFALALLDAAPDITLVTDQPLGVDHDRILALGHEADSADRMMALVARCDGLITIDSLAQHVADAADLPCVTLMATLPPSRFPYAPNTTAMVPAGMETLPGWSFTRLPQAGDARLEADYAHAWSVVSADHCWRLLRERIADRQRRPSAASGLVVADDRLEAKSAQGARFPHDVQSPVDLAIEAQMLHLSRLVLRPGHNVVMAGGHGAGFAASLARLVTPDGALHVFEARRLRAEAVVAEIAAEGTGTLHLHARAAAKAAAHDIVIADLDPLSDSDPAEIGNLLTTTTVSAMPFDELGLRHCRLVLLRPPQDPLGAIQGASAMLRTLRPLVLIGAVSRDVLAALDTALDPLAYTSWVVWAISASSAAALCLAAPAEAPFTLTGFERLRTSLAGRRP